MYFVKLHLEKQNKKKCSDLPAIYLNPDTITCIRSSEYDVPTTHSGTTLVYAESNTIFVDESTAETLELISKAELKPIKNKCFIRLTLLKKVPKGISNCPFVETGDIIVKPQKIASIENYSYSISENPDYKKTITKLVYTSGETEFIKELPEQIIKKIDSNELFNTMTLHQVSMDPKNNKYKIINEVLIPNSREKLLYIQTIPAPGFPTKEIASEIPYKSAITNHFLSRVTYKDDNDSHIEIDVAESAEFIKDCIR